ncbi:MAG: hypothetical protein AAFQ94_26340 [Bacteroidota bacterium]
MKSLVRLFSIALIFCACNMHDRVIDNGNVLFSNNSGGNIYFEISSHTKNILSDSLLSGEEQFYNIRGGIKKLTIFDEDGGFSIRPLTILSDQKIEISAITNRTISIFNNKDIPVYFHYQRYYEDKRPVVEHWSTFTENNQPKLIKAKESIDITLIDGYKYWGSITMDRSSLPGKKKVLFRVNEELSPVIL